MKQHGEPFHLFDPPESVVADGAERALLRGHVDGPVVAALLVDVPVVREADHRHSLVVWNEGLYHYLCIYVPTYVATHVPSYVPMFTTNN